MVTALVHFWILTPPPVYISLSLVHQELRGAREAKFVHRKSEVVELTVKVLQANYGNLHRGTIKPTRVITVCRKKLWYRMFSYRHLRVALREVAFLINIFGSQSNEFWNVCFKGTFI